jgi:hypothetical protein
MVLMLRCAEVDCDGAHGPLSYLCVIADLEAQGDGPSRAMKCVIPQREPASSATGCAICVSAGNQDQVPAIGSTTFDHFIFARHYATVGYQCYDSPLPTCVM